MAIAVLLIIASLLSASLNGRLRFTFVAAPALVGLAVAVASLYRPVTLDNGALVHGQPGLGLLLVVGVFAAVFVLAAGMLLFDQSVAMVE